MRSYVVQQGDTMWKIAQRYGISLDTLIAANPQLTNPNVLHIGDRINLPITDVAAPTPQITHTAPIGGAAWQYVVKQGDSMWKIAHQVGIPLDQLLMANPQIIDPNKIMPGQIVNVPGIQPSYGAPYSPPKAVPYNKQSWTMPKESLTAPKESYTAPMAPAPMPAPAPMMPPMFPPINVDADFNFTNIKQESETTVVQQPKPMPPVQPKPVPKMKPTPPAVAKFYIKEEVVQKKEPIGEQVICWDPCLPPPIGPIFEGPFIPATPTVHPPFTPIDPHVTKMVKPRESSSMWGGDSSWFKDSSL